MKPWLCLIFALLALPASGKAIELELWYQKQEAKEWIQQITQRWFETTGVRVRASYFPTSELKAALVRAVLSDSTPDIALVPSDFISDRRAFQLSAIPQELFNIELSESVIETVQVEGVRYGVPVSVGNHLLLYYNKKYVTEPATSWQQLEQQKPPLEKQGVGLLGYNFKEPYWFIAFLPVFDGLAVTDGKLTLATESMARTLQHYRELRDRGILSEQCDYQCAYHDFMAGKYAYSVNGDWAFRDYQKALGNQLGVALLPQVRGRNMRPVMASIALVLPGEPAKSDKFDAIKAFVHYLQSEPVQASLFATTRVLPVHQRVRERITAAEGENVAVLIEQLALAIALPPLPETGALWVGWRRGFDLYMSGYGKAPQAAQLMQNLAQHELQRSK